MIYDVTIDFTLTAIYMHLSDLFCSKELFSTFLQTE